MSGIKAIERMLSTQIKMRHLTLLRVLAASGSISAAAEALCVSQPAVSKSLAEIESILEGKLFHREARGIVPTELGEIVIHLAQRVHAEITLTAQELDDHRGGLGGSLTLGSFMVALPSLVPEALAMFYRDNPLASVSVITGTRERLLQGLASGEIDLVVGRLVEATQAQQLEQEPIYYEPIVLVSSANHPLLKRENLEAKELIDHQWVLPPSSSVVYVVLQMFFSRENCGAPERVITSQDYSLIRGLMQQMPLIAALPWQVVREDVKTGMLGRLPFDIDSPSLPVGIMTMKGRRVTPSVMRLHGCIKEVARQRFQRPDV